MIQNNVSMLNQASLFQTFLQYSLNYTILIAMVIILSNVYSQCVKIKMNNQISIIFASSNDK